VNAASRKHAPRRRVLLPYIQKTHRFDTFAMKDSRNVHRRCHGSSSFTSGLKCQKRTDCQRMPGAPATLVLLELSGNGGRRCDSQGTVAAAVAPGVLDRCCFRRILTNPGYQSSIRAVRRMLCWKPSKSHTRSCDSPASSPAQMVALRDASLKAGRNNHRQAGRIPGAGSSMIRLISPTGSTWSNSPSSPSERTSTTAGGN